MDKIESPLRILDMIAFVDHVTNEYDALGDRTELVKINLFTKERQEKLALIGKYIRPKLN